MSESGHIDLEVLEEYLLGKLEEKESEVVRRHVKRCALCDLELKRMERFLAIDADEELSRDAEWLYAQRRLETAFKEKISPGAGRPAGGIARLSRGTRVARWLVPVAAAAGIVFMLVRFAPEEKVEGPLPGPGIMRGAPAAVEYGIDLVAPVGEIEAAPAIFRWNADRDYTQYLLEIYTPNLEKVYIARGIAERSWIPPDSLVAGLETNVIYLWSVRGYLGFERPAVSPNGWFRIRP